MSGKNLLQFSQRSSFCAFFPHMFQQQFLVGFTIKPDDSRVNTGFSDCAVQAAGKNIFTPPYMLHDPNFRQVLQSILHMTVERYIMLCRQPEQADPWGDWRLQTPGRIVLRHHEGAESQP